MVAIFPQHHSKEQKEWSLAQSFVQIVGGQQQGIAKGQYPATLKLFPTKCISVGLLVPAKWSCLSILVPGVPTNGNETRFFKQNPKIQIFFDNNPFAVRDIIDLGSDEEKTKSNDQEKYPTFGNLEESSDENLYGKIVYNEQEAYDLYNEYGASIGFSIRRKQKKYDKYGVVRQLNFVCSKEGFREDSDPCKEKAIDRLETKTGCKARIRFSLDDDVWKVSTFNPNHNHKLARPYERQVLRSNRKISESHKGVIKTMTDCYNFVSREKMNLLEACNAQSLINLFKHKQVEDPMFFYTVQAMANAISTIFLGTCHCLWTWHISRNETLKLVSYYAIPEFKRLFNKFLKEVRQTYEPRNE
ncbi:unnamed protein product [Prunus armeniaca]|uniref:FAR1 domain-containing protein n=1 Tax=Prunus armeniaca TaxID=36596 RepID=A0A6J5Y0Z8_PRUAR|nr:unnamed protein product [Prunus armeniaca]